MLGTFGGALDARKINAKDGRLSCEVRGEVESEGGVLVIKRVHVTHSLRAEQPDDVRDTVERVHGVYAQSCPVYRSLSPAFQITSSVEIVPEGPAASGCTYRPSTYFRSSHCAAPRWKRRRSVPMDWNMIAAGCWWIPRPT